MREDEESDSPQGPLPGEGATGAEGPAAADHPGATAISRAARRVQIIAGMLAVLLLTGFTGWLAWSTFSHHPTVRILPGGDETSAPRVGGEGGGQRAGRAPRYAWHDLEHPARLRVKVVRLPWHRSPFAMIAGRPDARVSMATASYPWVHDPANPDRMTMNAASLPWSRAVDVASMSASGDALDTAALPWHQFASHPRPAMLATADVAFPPGSDFPDYRGVHTATHPAPLFMARAIVPALVMMDEEDGKALAYVEAAEVPWQRSLDESMLLEMAQAPLPWNRGVPIPPHRMAMSQDGRAVPPVYVPLAWVEGEPPAGEEEAKRAINALIQARAAAEKKATELAKAQEAAGRVMLEQQNRRRKELADARLRQTALWRRQLDRVTKGRIDRGAALQLAKNRVKRLMDAEKASLSVMTAVKTQKEAAPTWPEFVMSMARGADGSVWIGSEDDGVFRYDPATERLTQFTTKDGLGDDNGYAVAVDHQGRVWAGHLNHGVSVFDGQRWQCYEVVGGLSHPDTLSGPLGERIFDIAVCPTDGDVWIATSAGLSRYSPSHDDWSYYTRGMNLVHGEITVGSGQSAVGSGGEEVGGRQKAVGSEGHGQRTTGNLFPPSDQVQAIAFDAEGNIYCATQCDGMAMADAADGYRHWRIVRGSDRMPTEPAGEGLPTSLMNDVLVAKDGTVYAATTLGLAWSSDKGRTWRYVRGQDYADKVRGLYGGPPKGWTEKKPSDLSLPTADRPLPTLLPEDYVTTLAEGADGLIWLGFRQKGYEAMDPTTGRQYPVTSSDEQYVTALLPGAAKDFPAVGMYGDGQAAPARTVLTTATAAIEPPDLPADAVPLTEAQLAAMTDGVKALPSGFDSAAYLGEDWMTRGDWIGRYGRSTGILFANTAPWDGVIRSVEGNLVDARIGPHAKQDDAARRWIEWDRSEDPRVLYDPHHGYRRESELDDHGEAYPVPFEGPDLWISVEMPAGIHRVSLYFFNKDGHDGVNRNRDYVVAVRPWCPRVEDALAEHVLAHARVHQFRGGTYERFILRGGHKYWITVARNGSLNAICSGIFIDRLTEPWTAEDRRPLADMGYVLYRPAVERQDPAELAPIVQTTIKLFAGLDAGWDRTGCERVQRPYRVLAYRAAQSADAPYRLLGGFRWNIPVWSHQDRKVFSKTMAEALASYRQLNGR